MTTKQYLSQALVLDRKIKTKLAELSELESLAYTVKAINNGERVKSAKINNSNATIDKIIDLRNDINFEIDNLVDLKRAIKKVINKLDNDVYKNVLINRYVSCLTFEQCAVVLNYDVRYIYKLHNRAIKDIERQYKSVI